MKKGLYLPVEDNSISFVINDKVIFEAHEDHYRSYGERVDVGTKEDRVRFIEELKQAVNAVTYRESFFTLLASLESLARLGRSAEVERDILELVERHKEEAGQ